MNRVWADGLIIPDWFCETNTPSGWTCQIKQRRIFTLAAEVCSYCLCASQVESEQTLTCGSAVRYVNTRCLWLGFNLSLGAASAPPSRRSVSCRYDLIHLTARVSAADVCYRPTGCSCILQNMINVCTYFCCSDRHWPLCKHGLVCSHILTC